MERPFNEVFPDGLKQTIVLFEKALYHVMTTDEIDKVIKACTDQEEIDHLREFKEFFRQRTDLSWVDFHWIPMLHEIKSVDLLKNVITFMVTMDNMPNYRE